MAAGSQVAGGGGGSHGRPRMNMGVSRQRPPTHRKRVHTLPSMSPPHTIFACTSWQVRRR